MAFLLLTKSVAILNQSKIDWECFSRAKTLFDRIKSVSNEKNVRKKMCFVIQCSNWCVVWLCWLLRSPCCAWLTLIWTNKNTLVHNAPSKLVLRLLDQQKGRVFSSKKCFVTFPIWSQQKRAANRCGFNSSGNLNSEFRINASRQCHWNL